MFNNTKKTYKINYISATTWRHILLIKEKEVHLNNDKVIYDRSSTVPHLYTGVKMKIYNGKRFSTKVINNWSVGFKFGEFTWNRKLALYKAKQLKKKKKK